MKSMPAKPLPAPMIYAISPSGALDDEAPLNAGCEALAALGFPVRVDRAARARDRRFAGSDATRSAAFGRAARQSAPVVMATRGGYGLTRLLPMLDFERLAAAGKHWVGFSDFTAFHLAMFARTGAGTWAGPGVISFGREGGVDETTAGAFADAMSGRLEALAFACRGPAGVEEEGVLWGGNLAIVCALLGTPWFPVVDGGILFLEDTGEHPYRIERMFTQLVHAGVIGRQRAVLLGSFDNWRAAPHDRGYGLADAVRWLRSATRVPVIEGLPFGHGWPRLTLPHGARLGLATRRREAWLVFPDRH